MEQGSLWDATPQKRPQAQTMRKIPLELADQTKRIDSGLGTEGDGVVGIGFTPPRLLRSHPSSERRGENSSSVCSNKNAPPHSRSYWLCVESLPKATRESR